MCWDAIGQKGRLCQPLPWSAARVRGCVVGGRPGRVGGLGAGCLPPCPLLLHLHQVELPGLHRSDLLETWGGQTCKGETIFVWKMCKYIFLLNSQLAWFSPVSCSVQFWMHGGSLHRGPLGSRHQILLIHTVLQIVRNTTCRNTHTIKEKSKTNIRCINNPSLNEVMM